MHFTKFPHEQLLRCPAPCAQTVERHFINSTKEVPAAPTCHLSGLARYPLTAAKQCELARARVCECVLTTRGEESNRGFSVSICAPQRWIL